MRGQTNSESASIQKLANRQHHQATNAYGTIDVNREGDIVSISGVLLGMPNTAWTSLFAGMPKPISKITGVFTNAAASDYVYMAIDTDGTLKFYGKGTETTSDFNLIYMTIDD